MLIVHVVMAGIAVGFLLLLHLLGRHNAKAFRTDIDDQWYKRRVQDRDDLVSTARRLVQNNQFRPRADDENLWDYAAAFDRWSATQLNMGHTAQWSSPVENESRMVKLSPMPRMPDISRILSDAMKPVHEALRTATRRYPQANTKVSFTTTIHTYWWSVESDGLVHRAAKLQHDGIETWILWCDVNQHLRTEHVFEHLDGEGPLLTCLWCSTKQRRN